MLFFMQIKVYLFKYENMLLFKHISITSKSENIICNTFKYLEM